VSEYTVHETMEVTSEISHDELALAWESHHRSPYGTLAINGVLGVVAYPDREITGFVSVDLCEVVRETGAACREQLGYKGPFERTNEYAFGTLTTDAMIDSAVRSVANSELGVPVAEDIDETAKLLHRLRKGGAFVVANTSIVSGCEIATIDERLMATHLRGCFDGILFPRNHDGRGTMTKVGALALVVQQLGLDMREQHIAHIDDTSHHIKAFRERREQMASLDVVATRHIGNQKDPELDGIRYPTTAEAVEVFVKRQRDGWAA